MIAESQSCSDNQVSQNHYIQHDSTNKISNGSQGDRQLTFLSEGRSWENEKPSDQVIEFYKRLNWGAEIYEKFVIRAAKRSTDGKFDNKIFLGKFCPDGEIILYDTKNYHSKRKARKHDDLVKYQPNKIIDSPIEFLRKLGARGYNIFTMPNHLQPQGRDVHFTLGDRNCFNFNSLFYEIDDLALDQQVEKVNWLVEKTGLIPSLIVYSGSKSLHVYFALNENLKASAWKKLNKHLTAVVDGDKAINTLSRQMRLPGMLRLKDGEIRAQNLIFSSKNQYSFEEFKSKLSSLKTFDYEAQEKEYKSNRVAVKFASNFTHKVIQFCLENIPERQPGTGTYNDYLKIITCIKKLFGYEEGREYIDQYLPEMLYAFNACGKQQKTNNFDLIYLVKVCEKLCKDSGHNFELPQDLKQELFKRYFEKVNVEYSPKFDYLKAEEEKIKQQQKEEAEKAEETDKKSFIKFWWTKARKQLNKRIKRLKLAGLDPSTAKVELPKNIKFNPDLFPESTESKIIFDIKNDRAKVWLAAKKHNHKTILDTSYMGSGKSYAVPQIAPEKRQQVFYIDVNHNNPSIPAIEEGFANLYPRHKGLYRWKDGKLRNTPENEYHDPEIPSNCFLSKQHDLMRSKGYNLDNLDSNPICKRCPFNFKCSKERGDGFGFKFERKETLARPRVRAHIEQIPQDSDFSDGIAIVEEATASLQFTEERTGSINDLFKQFLEIAPDGIDESVLEPTQIELKELLKPLKTLLYEVKEEKIKQGKYGISHDSIFETIGEVPERLKELLPEIERLLTPNWDELIPEADSVAGVGGEFRDAGYFARAMFQRMAFQEALENLKNLPNNLLFEVIKIWCGDRGSLRINFQSITVTIPYSRHKQLLNKFGYRILLDATPNKNHLEKQLDCKILEVQEKLPNLSNLKILNVETEGLGSSQISDVAQDRFDALKNKFEEDFGLENLAVIGNKKDNDENYWFLDNRGTNKFKGMPAILAKGAPFPNVGAIKGQYRAMYGNLEGFEDYYSHLVASEVVQLVGRQRPQNYPEKGFICAIACSGLDLCYLEDFGIKVRNVNAVDVTFEAGTDVQKSKIAILTAAKGIIKEGKGKRLTQENIAELAGISQAYVAKLSKTFSSGWQDIKKILLDLYKPLNRESNNFSEDNYLFGDELLAWIGANPIEALASLVRYIHKKGFKSLEELVSSLSREDAHLILGLLSMLHINKEDLPVELIEAMNTG